MSDGPHTKPEPRSFADLANQPSGSGVAAEQAAFMEAALDGAAVNAPIDAGVGDQSSAYTKAETPPEGGPTAGEGDVHAS